jgi:hypothetical protein
MTENTTTTVEAPVVEEETVTIVKPYDAHKLVNEALAANGLDKRIPPQMMYNYTSARVNAGKKPFIGWTAETGVDLDSLQEWTDKYVAKQLALVTPVVEETDASDEA